MRFILHGMTALLPEVSTSTRPISTSGNGLLTPLFDPQPGLCGLRDVLAGLLSQDANDKGGPANRRASP